MHVIFAMLPSKRNHTSITFKGKYKSKRLIKQCVYCCIWHVINIHDFEYFIFDMILNSSTSVNFVAIK